MQFVLPSAASTPHGLNPVSANLPLSMAHSGETVALSKIRAKGDLLQHLHDLGFVEGASITVVSQVAGNVVLKLKSAQIALDRETARRILVNLR